MRAVPWIGFQQSHLVQLFLIHRLGHPIWSPFATIAANCFAPHWLRLQAGSSGDCNQNAALAKIDTHRPEGLRAFNFLSGLSGACRRSPRHTDAFQSTPSNPNDTCCRLDCFCLRSPPPRIKKRGVTLRSLLSYFCHFP